MNNEEISSLNIHCQKKRSRTGPNRYSFPFLCPTNSLLSWGTILFPGHKLGKLRTFSLISLLSCRYRSKKGPLIFLLWINLHECFNLPHLLKLRNTLPGSTKSNPIGNNNRKIYAFMTWYIYLELALGITQPCY